MRHKAMNRASQGPVEFQGLGTHGAWLETAPANRWRESYARRHALVPYLPTGYSSY